MSPIATALLAAASAGVVGGTVEVSKKLIVDAYDALKAAIVSKLGEESDVARAIEGVETKPESQNRHQVLIEDLEDSGANKDEELVELAQHLIDAIKNIEPADSPAGRIIRINHSTLTASDGSQIVVGDGNISITGQSIDDVS